MQRPRRLNNQGKKSPKKKIAFDLFSLHTARALFDSYTSNISRTLLSQLTRTNYLSVQEKPTFWQTQKGPFPATMFVPQPLFFRVSREDVWKDPFGKYDPVFVTQARRCLCPTHFKAPFMFLALFRPNSQFVVHMGTNIIVRKCDPKWGSYEADYRFGRSRFAAASLVYTMLAQPGISLMSYSWSCWSYQIYITQGHMLTCIPHGRLANGALISLFSCTFGWQTKSKIWIFFSSQGGQLLLSCCSTN